MECNENPGNSQDFPRGTWGMGNLKGFGRVHFKSHRQDETII